jgi:hypothetical protein
MHIYFKTKVMNGILAWCFFMVYDIDIHQLNLGQFGNLKFLDEISFKQCFFFAFLNNKCKMIYFLKNKTISKRRRFYKALHYKTFFCLVMFHEPQT